MLVQGSWQWSPAGAKAVPYAHIWGSRIWDNDPLDVPFFGETTRPRNATYSKGASLPGLTGQAVCGGESEWSRPALFVSAGRIEVDDHGRPLCCQPSAWPGEGDADGGSAYACCSRYCLTGDSDGGTAYGESPTVLVPCCAVPIAVELTGRFYSGFSSGGTPFGEVPMLYDPAMVQPGGAGGTWIGFADVIDPITGNPFQFGVRMWCDGTVNLLFGQIQFTPSGIWSAGFFGGSYSCGPPLDYDVGDFSFGPIFFGDFNVHVEG